MTALTQALQLKAVIGGQFSSGRNGAGSGRAVYGMMLIKAAVPVSVRFRTASAEIDRCRAAGRMKPMKVAMEGRSPAL